MTVVWKAEKMAAMSVARTVGRKVSWTALTLVAYLAAALGKKKAGLSA